MQHKKTCSQVVVGTFFCFIDPRNRILGAFCIFVCYGLDMPYVLYVTKEHAWMGVCNTVGDPMVREMLCDMGY